MGKLTVLSVPEPNRAVKNPMVTDGMQKWSPAQNFSDKSVKMKGNKSVEMHMFLICGNEWALAYDKNDKSQFYLARPTKILIWESFFCNYFNLLPNTYTQRYIHICHSFIPNSGTVNRSKTPQFQQGFYKWKKCSKPTNNITGNMEKFTKFTKRNPWIIGTKQIKSPNCWRSIRGRERGD